MPGARYGLISAAFVVFTLVITDFGLPKVIGGQYNVLAVDIYKQVIGQQNFEMGAVVSVVLLVPALLAFAVDRLVQKKQVALLSARSVPYRAASPTGASIALCWSTAAWWRCSSSACSASASSPRWSSSGPTTCRCAFKNYDFDRHGRRRLGRLLQLDRAGAADGGDRHGGGLHRRLYGRKDRKGCSRGAALFQFLAMLPMAVPGMVLGLAYIFFFNDPAQPAELHLRHHGDPGDLHHHPLLYRGAPDRADGAEADGPRVRVGLGLAQAAVLASCSPASPCRSACRPSSTSRSICSSTP